MKEQLIKEIEQADDLLIGDVINAVINRYAKEYPEWEIMFLSMHKEPKQRAKDIKMHMKFLKRHKEMGSLD